MENDFGVLQTDQNASVEGCNKKNGIIQSTAACIENHKEVPRSVHLIVESILRIGNLVSQNSLSQSGSFAFSFSYLILPCSAYSERIQSITNTF